MSKWLLALALVCCTAGQAQLQFVDQWEHNGFTVCPTNLMVLFTEQPKTFAALPAYPPPKPVFISWPVGGDKDRWMSLMIGQPVAEQATMWVDVSRNWRFEAEEEFPLQDLTRGTETVRGVEVSVPLEAEPAMRTVRIWQGAIPGTMILSMRGYCAGKVQLGDQAYDALLADVDFSGKFNDRGRDMLYVDLNADGKFSTLGERFELAEVLRIGGNRYQVEVAPDGRQVTALAAEEGKGRLTLTALGKTSGKVTVLLRRDDGETVTIQRLGEAVELPAGQWRIQSVDQLTMEDSTGRWAYGLYLAAPDKNGITVKRGSEAAFDLLGKLTPQLSLGATGLRIGKPINVSVTYTSASGIMLAGFGRAGQNPQETPRLVLLTPAGKVVGQAKMAYG